MPRTQVESWVRDLSVKCGGPGAALTSGGLAPLSLVTGILKPNGGPKRRRAAALQRDQSADQRPQRKCVTCLCHAFCPVVSDLSRQIIVR